MYSFGAMGCGLGSILGALFESFESFDVEVLLNKESSCGLACCRKYKADGRCSSQEDTCN